MASNPLKTVVITGVSSGVGFEAALDLAAHGYHVFGSVRTQNDAERVQAAIGGRFTALVFDVTDAAAVQAGAAQVQRALGAGNLTALVNNAGMNAVGPLMHVPLDEVRRMFEVNVFGMLAVTQAFLPLLGARAGAPKPRGRIVNLSSLAGGVTFPFFGAYSASKHALESLNDALRRELVLYGIDVVAVEPPSIRTPIFDKVAAVDPRYAATDFAPALAGMGAVMAREWKQAIPVSRAAGAIRRAIEARRPRARYPLTPLWYLRHLLGMRAFDAVANARMGGIEPLSP
jgi:NAD(P)-dependent dehydrogenase (short-subunit alcohol dehydrogenase family)